MTNQVKEIRDFIRDNPGTSTEDIVRGTGWSRHLVETALKLMTQSAIIQEVGRTDWDDPKYRLVGEEAEVETELPKDQREGTVENIVKQINTDLSLGGSSKVLSNFALGGIIAMAAFKSPFSGFVENAIKANAAVEEEKLREEKLKQIMEQQATYYPGISYGWVSASEAVDASLYTFIVTTPNNDRITVKAVDCIVDYNALVFRDDEQATVMAIAAGHWVKVERLEEKEEQSNGY